MAAKYISAPGSAQVINADNTKIKSVLLTAGSADATAKVYGAGDGDEVIPLAAKAGTSVQWVLPSAIEYAGNMVGPVKIDLAGTAAQARIDF